MVSCTVSQDSHEKVSWKAQTPLTEKAQCVCRNVLFSLWDLLPLPPPYLLMQQYLLGTWNAAIIGYHGKADMTFLQWDPTHSLPIGALPTSRSYSWSSSYAHSTHPTPKESLELLHSTSSLKFWTRQKWIYIINLIFTCYVTTSILLIFSKS